MARVDTDEPIAPVPAAAGARLRLEPDGRRRYALLDGDTLVGLLRQPSWRSSRMEAVASGVAWVLVPEGFGGRRTRFVERVSGTEVGRRNGRQLQLGSDPPATFRREGWRGHWRIAALMGEPLVEIEALGRSDRHFELRLGPLAAARDDRALLALVGAWLALREQSQRSAAASVTV
jgi:hypothetical protein